MNRVVLTLALLATLTFSSQTLAYRELWEDAKADRWDELIGRLLQSRNLERDLDWSPAVDDPSANRTSVRSLMFRTTRPDVRAFLSGGMSDVSTEMQSAPEPASPELQRDASLNDIGSSAHVYVRHLTADFPNPTLIVGGRYPNPRRPTLHWSILGSEAFIEEKREGGKPEEHDINSRPYAILERMDHLAPRIVGGEYFDIYSEHTQENSYTPSKAAYLFLPFDKYVAVDRLKFPYELIPYNPKKETVVQAVHRFAEEKRFIEFWRFAVAIPLNKIHPDNFPENSKLYISKLSKLISKHVTPHFEEEGRFPQSTATGILTTIGLTVIGDVPVHYFVLRDQLIIMSPNSFEDRKSNRLLSFWTNLGIEGSDTLLISESFEVISLSNIFCRYGIPTGCCGFSHCSSKLRKAEKLFSKLWIIFKSHAEQLVSTNCQTSLEVIKQNFIEETNRLLDSLERDVLLAIIHERSRAALTRYFKDNLQREIDNYTRILGRTPAHQRGSANTGDPSHGQNVRNLLANPAVNGTDAFAIADALRMGLVQIDGSHEN